MQKFFFIIYLSVSATDRTVLNHKGNERQKTFGTAIKNKILFIFNPKKRSFRFKRLRCNATERYEKHPLRS
jgi:hypothetical protein